MNRLLKALDTLTDSVTMYRLALYYVAGIWVVALVFGAFGILHYAPLAMLVSAIVLLAVSLATNAVFAGVFGAPSNIESAYITVGILALIITPTMSLAGISFLIWAAVWAMAAKYILAIKKKHIFNPAAFAVALTALTIYQSASWWVGNVALLPFVIAGGVMMVRKIHRSDLVYSFLATAVVVTMGASILKGVPFFTGARQLIVSSPLIFFACVMLTEPMTTPPRRGLRIAYGALVGLLFAPFVHLGSLYSTPELALLAGNVFSYLASPKRKMVLRLKEKRQITHDVYEFTFVPDQKLQFRAGQYLEWTLGHEGKDTRGIRRFFTIASSPTKPEISVGVKFYARPSSYKKTLLRMKPGDTIVASQLAGDFTLPSDATKKLVFIAGGIGITPFRSMVQYLLDRGEQRTITLLYANKTMQDIAYSDTFNQAAEKLRMNTVYAISDQSPISENTPIVNARIDDKLITRYVPDWRERMYFISGPHAMVVSCKEQLRAMGVHHTNIKTDYFPGLA